MQVAGLARKTVTGISTEKNEKSLFALARLAASTGLRKLTRRRKRRSTYKGRAPFLLVSEEPPGQVAAKLAVELSDQV